MIGLIIRAEIHLNRRRIEQHALGRKIYSARVRVAAIPSSTPGLIVNKSLATKGEWSVTHRRSGKKIGPDFPTCQKALRWADALEQLGTWDRPGNEVKRYGDAAYRILGELEYEDAEAERTE